MDKFPQVHLAALFTLKICILLHERVNMLLNSNNTLQGVFTEHSNLIVYTYRNLPFHCIQNYNIQVCASSKTKFAFPWEHTHHKSSQPCQLHAHNLCTHN